MTKQELKRIAQEALDSEYGFKPALDRITLLESNDDGTYIAFTVRGRYYAFRSYRWASGEIWCGSGTIEKLPEYDIPEGRERTFQTDARM